MPERIKAEIVVVGDEILSGTTTDTNSGVVARVFAELGIGVQRVTQVGDVTADIQVAVRTAMERARVVVVSGGLGPTPDDHTKEDLAALFADPLAQDDAVLENIRKRFAARGLDMPPINAKQAFMPRAGRRIDNRIGSAPGVHWSIAGSEVFLLPGVPVELETMLREEIVPRLQARFPHAAPAERLVFRTTGLPESTVAQQLVPIMQRFAADGWAFYPSWRGVDVVVTLRRRQNTAIVRQAVRAEIGAYVFSEQAGRGLEEVVGDELVRTRLTLAVAESCTGGLLGKRITDAPGSSAYFLGGFVTYSNTTKREWLDVPATLLDLLGAVSAPVAVALARGARSRAGTDLALAITGIAGPAGGTAEKPVGLVYVALAAPSAAWTRRLQLGWQRDANREVAAQAALDMLRRHLQQLAVGDPA